MKRFLMSFTILVFVLLIGENAFASWNCWEWIFRSMKYKDQIEIETYLMTKEQLCPFIEGDKATQLNYDKLINKDQYLVIRLKNIGDAVTWGTLSCRADTKEFEINIPLIFPKEYSLVIISAGGVGPRKRDQLLPQITVEWEDLYVK